MGLLDVTQRGGPVEPRANMLHAVSRRNDGAQLDPCRVKVLAEAIGRL
jgi:hypothetical protein